MQCLYSICIFSGTSGGELFELSLKGPVQAQGSITDYGNGTYQAFYLCSQRGNYKLKVTLNGINVGLMVQGTAIIPSPVGNFSSSYFRYVVHILTCPCLIGRLVSA